MINKTHRYILEQAILNQPEIDLLKIDFDEFDDIAEDYFIGSLPTFILFKNGKGNFEMKKPLFKVS